MAPLVTLLFLKVEGQNLVGSGILMCFLQKFFLIFNFYDVIIGNMEGFVTLLFIKVELQNLADWGILICTFQKLSIFKIEGF